MRNRTLATITLVGALLLLPSSAIGQVPTQDSVTATGATVASGYFSDLQIDARSGPSGENPTGTVSLTIPNPIHPGSGLGVQGAVTCLAVNGNEATLVFAANFFYPFMKIVVVDNAATGAPDAAGAVFLPLEADPDCSDSLVVLASPITSGDITVVDAQPLPTTKDQCKAGGWRNFPQFKNEGQCIKFVQQRPNP